MTIEAMKLSLEALENCVATCFDQYAHEQVMSRPEHFVNQTITALRQAIEQEEQDTIGDAQDKLIAEMAEQAQKPKGQDVGGHLFEAAYVAQQRQPWVGLTDEDKQIAFDDTQEGGGFWEFADAIEAKLKEKNNG